MDKTTEYIWQRRIHRAVQSKKYGALFPESVRLGLEFNAALEKKEKLDVSLLTNAVVLELWDFSRCVAKSEAHFLFEILEFNFDLGVDAMSEVQYQKFVRVVHVKTKVMCSTIKPKHEKCKETFPLPQLVDEKVLEGSEQKEKNRNETLDVSLLTAGSKTTQISENQKTDNVDESFTLRGRAPLKMTQDSFPHCKKLGVKLFIQEENAPKEKLHTDQLTKGVMMELLSFSRALCGIRSGIVCELIKLNFGLDMNKGLFYARVNKIMERKNLCIKEEDREAFRKELFPCQSRKQRKLQKRKIPDNDYQEVEGLLVQGKRWSSLRDFESKGTEICQDKDLSYMCPVDFETEMLSDTETEQEKDMSVSCTSDTPAEIFAVAAGETKVESAEKVSAAAEETQAGGKTSEASEEVALQVVIKEEEEEVFVSSVQPQIKGYNSQLPKANRKHRAFRSISRLFSTEKHQDQSVKTPKQSLWIRRAFRSKQILQSSTVTDRFAGCRAIGLDFNVGAGRGEKLSLQLFTNGVLCEVHRFATCMQKSIHSFTSEILENNFKVVFLDEAQQRNFVTAMVSRGKVYESHPDRRSAEFLNSPFTLQESPCMAHVESDFQTEEVFREEQGELDSELSAATKQEASDQHPFCRKLGLDLWSTERRPASQRLDFLSLTKGAVLEIIKYVRHLCGNVRKTVTDVLEHNFDLDLRDPKSRDKKELEKWYYKYRTVMTKYPISKKKKEWFKELIYVLPDPDVQDLNPASKGNVVRPSSRYSTCEKIGLDFSIGPSQKTKRKLHLGVLTRRLLFEIHQFVMRNSTQYIPTLYQILENNFDLSSQSHRKVEFAWEVSSQVLGIAAKVGRKGGYLDKPVELPLEYSQAVCKEEPQDDFTDQDRSENSDVKFIRELKPVDIEVEIE
ncbi:uncharacterized protein LOC141791186 [Halichoeres trimaculatus]|uniref:uncharacterized protein LOC141791186 n=1 Tax=Halichoeres trimaculatus TaxID=147232 RepID=UPI003D9DC616